MNSIAVRSLVKWVAISALILISTSCSNDDATNPATTGEIHGVVYDGTTLAPLKQVLVTTVPPTSSVLSDDNGAFRFTNVAPGSIIVQATKPGVGSGSTSITVSAGKDTQADLFLLGVPSGKGSVVGTVRTEQGAAVAGATVTTTPPTQSATTDANGYYQIALIDTGTYAVSASKTGVGTGAATVVVLSDLATQGDIVLALYTPVISNGLVAYYPLAGTAGDASGNNYSGTMEGNPTFATDRKGATGGCIHFDGATQRIRVAHTAIFNSLPMSMAFWVKFEGTPNPDALLLGKFLHPSGEGYSMFTDNGAFCGSYTRENFSSNARSCGSMPNFSSWVHVAVTYSTNGTIVYLNGTEHSTAGWAGTASATITNQDFMMGLLVSSTDPPGTTQGLNGWMDEVYIFNRVLTESEVLQLAN